MTNLDAAAQLDSDNPWPGLEAFQENARAFFRGRDKEAKDLLDHVLDQPVTVLFGRSGLGKTSLLRAGLFPLLREHNCLPIYVRFTLKPGALPLDQQILDALRASVLTEVPNAVLPSDDESLWEYLHRQDFKLWSPQNYPLIPVLVLDQFEELYTLGEKVPELVEPFRNDLGDLAENRIPPALAARTIATRLQVRSQRYKLLISLREDFLPELEGWRRLIPSLGRNRMRLQRLQAADALDAVYTPAAHMMTKELAERIVAIIAGEDLRRGDENHPSNGSQESHPGEVEPPLLSLFCRELNEERKRRGQSHFDAELVEESKGDILSNYYKSCVASLPDSAAEFVETELITEKGFRNSFPRDDALQTGRLSEDELSQLIRLRLLRVEERYGTPRIELTHDVLTGVVRKHREKRLARQRAEKEKAELRAEADKEAQAKREAQAYAAVLRKRDRILSAIVAAALATAVFAVREYYVAQRNLNSAEALKLFASADLSLENDGAQNAFYQLLAAQKRTEISNTLEPEYSDAKLFEAAVATRDLVKVFRPPAATASIRTLDGLNAIISTRSSDGSECSLGVWNLSTGKKVGSSIAAKSCVYFATPDAQRIATLADDGTVQLWDTNGKPDGEAIHPIQGAITTLVFSPDVRSLYIGGDDGTVRTWDLSTRKESGSPVQVSTTPVTSIAISSDGRRLIVASDRTIHVLDSTSGQSVGQSMVAEYPVLGLSVNSDGRFIAARSASPKFRERSNVADSERERWDTGAANLTKSQQSKPPDKTEKTDSGFRVQVWKTDTGEAIEGDWVTASQRNGNRSINMSKDGERLITGGPSGLVQVWNLQRKSLIVQEAMGDLPVHYVGFNDADQGIFASADNESLPMADTVRVWKSHLVKPPVSQQFSSIAFSSDGKRVATGDAEEIQIRDTATGNFDANRKPMAVGGTVYGLAFSADGARIASAAADGTLQIWDTASGSKIGEPITASESPLWSVAFSPDGRHIVSGNEEGMVQIWDSASHEAVGRPLYQPVWDEGLEAWKGVTSVAYNREGTRIISGSEDGTVRVWDALTGEVVGKPIPTGHADDRAVWSVAISPDGQRAVSGGVTYNAGVVDVWDVDTGSPVEPDSSAKGNARHHQKGVRSLAFSPNGEWFTSGGDDGVVQFWSAKFGRQIGEPIAVKDGSVIGLAVSPDGQRVTFGTRYGAFGTLPGLDRLDEQLCAKLVVNMSRQQWKDLVGDDHRYDPKICPSLPVAPE